MYKKILIVLLCMTLIFGIITACGEQEETITITNTSPVLENGDEVTAESNKGNAVKFKIEPAVSGIIIDENTGVVTYAPGIANGAKFKVIAYTGNAQSQPVEFTVSKEIITIGNTSPLLESGDAVTAASNKGGDVKFKIVPAVSGITIDEDSGEVTYADEVTEGTNFTVIAYNDTAESQPTQFTVEVPIGKMKIYYNGSGEVADGESIWASSNKPSATLTYALTAPTYGITVSEDGVVNFASFIPADTEFAVMISGGGNSITQTLKTKFGGMYFSSRQEFILDLGESKLAGENLSDAVSSGIVVFESDGTFTSSMTANEFFASILRTYGLLGEDETELVIDGSYGITGSNTCIVAMDDTIAEFTFTVQDDFTLRGEVEYLVAVDAETQISVNLIGYTESAEMNYYQEDITFKFNSDLSSELIPPNIDTVTFTADGYAIIAYFIGDSSGSTEIIYSIYDYNKSLVMYNTFEAIQIIFYFITPDILCYIVEESGVNYYLIFERM